MLQGNRLRSSWNIKAGASTQCACLSRDGLQIAIGTDTEAIIVERDSGNDVARIQSEHGPVTGLAFGRKGRIIVGCGGSVRLYRIESKGVIDELALSEDKGSVRIALHPSREVLGAVSESGRVINVLDIDLQIRARMAVPSKCGNISELHWLSRTTLLATSTDGLHVWRYSHTAEPAHASAKVKPSLTLGQSIGLVTASASPETSALAGASRDGVVYIWTVEEDSGAEEHDEALSADLRSTLKEYPQQVHPMCWDKHGKYLATADGPEATVWDVPRLLKETIQSTVCTGHEASSRILEAAFQEDGPMLATAADDGTVLIFNSDRFQPGKHSKPTACIHPESGKQSVSSLLWTPGGKLVVGFSNGKVGLWGISHSVPPQNLNPSHSLNPPHLGRISAQREALENLTIDSEQGPRIPQIHTPQPMLPSEEPGFARSPVLGPIPLRKVQRPVPPSELPKSGGNSANGLTRQRSGTKGNLLSKMSNASMISDKSSSFRSRDGLEFRHQQAENRKAGGEDRSWGSPSLQNQQSLLSGDSLSDRSRSLQDSQPAGTRTSSLERGAGLSPGLWQSIQNVGRKKSQTQMMTPREPAGWGQGLPSSVPGGQQGVPVQMPGPVPMPYAPGSHNQINPGPFMMVANPAMGSQYIPPQPGFPHHHMAPMPMMTHSVTPPGVVDSSGMHGYPQQMIYMHMPPNMSPQPQWPHQMMQGPHPGTYMYMVHPSQSGMQNPAPPVGVLPMARASSVPDDQIGNWKDSPQKGDRGQGEWVSIGGGQNQHVEDLKTNSISLPETMTEQWRKKAPEMRAQEIALQNGKGPDTDRSLRQASEGLMSANKNGRGDSQDGAQKSENDTVYVGNLAANVNEQHLQNIFQKFGTITHTQVIRDKLTMMSRGFGFVSFLEPEAASNAIVEMNGQKVFGMFNSRSLKVSSSNRPAQGRQ